MITWFRPEPTLLFMGRTVGDGVVPRIRRAAYWSIRCDAATTWILGVAVTLGLVGVIDNQVWVVMLAVAVVGVDVVVDVSRGLLQRRARRLSRQCHVLRFPPSGELTATELVEIASRLSRSGDLLSCEMFLREIEMSYESPGCTGAVHIPLMSLRALNPTS